MNRLLTTAAVLIALTVPAYAGPRGPFYPPPEYDHAFAGETIVVKDWDQDVLRSMGCSVKNVPRGIKVTVAGCTQVGGYKGACIIFVAKSSVLKKHGYTVEDIVRHETGHCNGWKHPEDFGARMKEEEGLRAFHLKHKKVQGPALYSKPTAMVPPADFLPPLRF